MMPMAAMFMKPMAAGMAASGAAVPESLVTILNKAQRRDNKLKLGELDTEIAGFDTSGISAADQRIMEQQITMPGLASLNQAGAPTGNFGGFTDVGGDFAKQLQFNTQRSGLIGELGRQAYAQIRAADMAEELRQEAELERLKTEREARLAFKTQANKELMAAWLAPIQQGAEGFAQALDVEKLVGEGGVAGERQSPVPSGWDNVDQESLDLIFDGGESLTGVV